MKTFSLALLAAAVWIFVGYSASRRVSNEPTPPPESNRPAVVAGTQPQGSPVASPPLFHRTVSYGEAVSGSMGRIGGGGNVYTPTFVQLGSNELRKFTITISHVDATGALANGCFYDVDPSVTTDPERLPASDRGWTQGGMFIVYGLPAESLDGSTWVGWLVRDGRASYHDALGSAHTVASYRVASAPGDVPVPKGSWRPTGTALDKPAR